MTDDRVVIGGKAKLRNVIKGNTSLQNLLNGSPGVQIRSVGAKGGISNAVKEALLDCFEHVVWIDGDGQVYYQALYDALYAKELVSISAVFNQGQAVIYDSDSLDDLKQYLTVTASYDDGTSETVASTDYTLSGTLNPGTSTISVAYEGKMAYFNVTVTHMPGTVTITNTLTGCTNSNSASSATEGDSYSGTISASSGYTLTGATVSITMGGTDITSTAYNNGTISIAELTGNVVITITAVAVTLSSISAVYTQSGTVYDTDTLDSLKTDLVVTATYSDSSTATVPGTDYTLSGTLTVGTSTVTVTYEGKTTTFTVTVTEYTIPALYNWDFTQSLTDSVASKVAQIGGSVTQSSSGLVFSGTDGCCVLGDDVFPINRTLEVDISYMNFTNNGAHGRLIMFNDGSSVSTSANVGNGFILRSYNPQYWSIYKGGWADNYGADKNMFNGKKLTMKYYQNESDSKYYTDIYCDATLICSYSSSTKWNTTGINPLQIGSSANAYKDVTITGLRIYEGV